MMMGMAVMISMAPKLTLLQLSFDVAAVVGANPAGLALSWGHHWCTPLAGHFWYLKSFRKGLVYQRHRCSREMKEKEKRKEDIMMARCFSKGMARWLSTHLVTYAVTALAPGHMAFTDASKDNNHFWGLLYSCLQPFSASFSSPGRHKTHARFNSPGAPFACFLKNLQSFSGCR